MILDHRPYSSNLRKLRRRLREHKYWRPRLAYGLLAMRKLVVGVRKCYPTNGS